MVPANKNILYTKITITYTKITKLITRRNQRWQTSAKAAHNPLSTVVIIYRAGCEVLQILPNPAMIRIPGPRL